MFKLQNVIIILTYFTTFLGNLGIGHTRYSTSAGSEEVNCQPFVVHSAHGALAVAHNGELFNAGRLRRMVNAILFILVFMFHHLLSRDYYMFVLFRYWLEEWVFLRIQTVNLLPKLCV